MNTKPLIIAMALVVSAGAAFAADPVTSAPLSRAEVRAEYERARLAGELPKSTDSYGGYVYASRPTPASVTMARASQAAAKQTRAATPERVGSAQ